MPKEDRKYEAVCLCFFNSVPRRFDKDYSHLNPLHHKISVHILHTPATRFLSFLFLSSLLLPALFSFSPFYVFPFLCLLFWRLSEWGHVHHNTQIQHSIRQLNWRIVLSWTLNNYEYPLMLSEKCNHSPESNAEWFADDFQEVFCFSNRYLFSWRSNAFFREVCIFAR